MWTLRAVLLNDTHVTYSLKLQPLNYCFQQQILDNEENKINCHTHTNICAWDGVLTIGHNSSNFSTPGEASNSSTAPPTDSICSQKPEGSRAQHIPKDTKWTPSASPLPS